MSYKLFLDDERSPYKVHWIEMPLGPWDIVRSYKEFVEFILKNGIPAHVSFDHDLADEHYHNNNTADYKEKTGYHCAQWLTEYCLDNNLPFPPFTEHSLNPIGRENIATLIESFNNR